MDGKLKRPRHLSDDMSKYYILVDVECSVPNRFVSEIYAALICETKEATCVIDYFYRLCQVPKIRSSVAQYVYTHITGLSFKTLTAYGVIFSDAIDDLKSWLEQYDHIPLYARDPAMERTMLKPALGDRAIIEVCELLHEPYDREFMSKRSKLRKLCSVSCHCSYHDPVVSREPHCAVKDVHDMALWIKFYGK